MRLVDIIWYILSVPGGASSRHTMVRLVCSWVRLVDIIWYILSVPGGCLVDTIWYVLSDPGGV